MRQEACNLLIDYFNHQLSEKDKALFEEHLKTCESCQEELNELEELTQELPFMSESVTPPAQMKGQVLENVFSSKQEEEEEQKKTTVAPIQQDRFNKRNWLTPLLAAGLLLSVLGNGLLMMNQTDKDTTQEEEISLDKTQLSTQLTPSEGLESQANATMVEQQDGVSLVIQANNLSQLEGEETYQVWVLEDGEPYRAGTFVPNEDGFGAVSYKMDFPEEHNWDTIAITIEPDATSETPRGDIILSAAL
ncbi:MULTISPECIES: anti-sigma factor [Paraliobacillus]|uniref:anti-sigma factor n=1 Tax=Paraliobacillus TaxID=200903 RepID=UPI000DD36A06|nr:MULTISPECIES: anti-sigma factor [Paraliobacillus]